MIRVSILVLLLTVGRPYAQPAATRDFDRESLALVYGDALSFVAPRILQAVPVSELTIRGLQSLSTWDPDIRVIATEKHLRLLQQDQPMLDLAAPVDDTPAQWADTAATLTAAGQSASAVIRRVGMQGIIQGFFDAMFSHLDPYSRYVPPAEASNDRARRAGRAGLGLTLGQRGPLVEVVSVVRDSPAAQAGIKPADILAAVDGQHIQDQDPATVAALLVGAEGSIVTLSWRGRDGRTRDAQLIRAMVPPETVFSQRTEDVLMLRITGFSASTSAHIAQSVQDALADPHRVAGIILDLRDNRGGLLRQAVIAADTFLPAGPIATTTGRDPDAVNIWRSTDGELAENVPLVVLVDGRTASAAEILAAALADRGRAVVVGSETVGKGMVQTINPLPNGGELFVTWSQIIAPRRWPLQGVGVMPQLCTSVGRDAALRQLAALSNGFQPMAEVIRRSRDARLPVSAAEVMEIRAPCTAANGTAVDLETARFLIANPAAYAAALLPPMATH